MSRDHVAGGWRLGHWMPRVMPGSCGSGSGLAQWNLWSQKRWTVVCKLKQVSTNHRLFNLSFESTVCLVTNDQLHQEFPYQWKVKRFFWEIYRCWWRLNFFRHRDHGRPTNFWLPSWGWSHMGTLTKEQSKWISQAAGDTKQRASLSWWLLMSFQT